VSVSKRPWLPGALAFSGADGVKVKVLSGSVLSSGQVRPPRLTGARMGRPPAIVWPCRHLLHRWERRGAAARIAPLAAGSGQLAGAPRPPAQQTCQCGPGGGAASSGRRARRPATDLAVCHKAGPATSSVLGPLGCGWGRRARGARRTREDGGVHHASNAAQQGSRRAHASELTKAQPKQRRPRPSHATATHLLHE
jgi:hypothetical protein